MNIRVTVDRDSAVEIAFVLSGKGVAMTCEDIDFTTLTAAESYMIAAGMAHIATGLGITIDDPEIAETQFGELLQRSRDTLAAMPPTGTIAAEA